MFHRRSLAPAVLLLLGGSLTAQTTLVRANGVIGGPLHYSMQGDPGEAYALFPSPQPGPTPVSMFNPGDPRLLSVGLNHPSLWTIGILDGSGAAVRAYQLPNEPALQGLVAYAQFVTFTVGPLRIDDVSNPTSFVFGSSGTSHATVGEMLRDATSPTATRLLDGRALIAGGSQTLGGSSTTTNAMELFDPQTQTFQATTPMAEARVLQTATRLDDGRVLLLGGADNADIILATGEIYDPVTETVSAIAPMAVPRAGHTATLLEDGRVFVAGGTSDFDFSNPLAALGEVHKSTALYDPDGDSWSSGPDLPKPRVLATATRLLDGRAMLSGGIEVTVFILPIPSWSNDCRAFDPDSGAFQNLANFSSGRAMHAQLLLSDGSVLMTGGTDGDLINQVFTPRADCQVYSPGPDSWSSAGSMASPRALGTTLVERAGGVHVIGGLSTVDLGTLTGTPVTDIERADLGVFNWGIAGAMSSPRQASASVALEGGQRILTVGSTGVGIDRSAEIFIP